MYVVGTSGHVDHGKSSLVRALTGIDPDRLAEEKLRGMTIDLGFAWLRLPSGKEISIIDVPGHQQFIENMLAGVGAIDAVILVVAADDGVMPQTREHLAILDLLQISKGVVALTKIDTVDQSLRDLALEEVRSLVDSTALRGSTIVPLSAITGEGLAEFASALDGVLESTPPRSNLERPRLWIDRAFTRPGFGTIVTGTLIDGILRTGQEVEILPGRILTRIRRIETHKRLVERAMPGTRVAVNLPGLDVADLRRGNVLAIPDCLHPTKRLDVRLHCWAGTDEALPNSVNGRFFSGSFSCEIRVRLLDRDLLLPGETGYAQLLLDSEAALARGDRFIVRRPALRGTVGGGLILNPHPLHHRRKDAAVLNKMTILESGNPDQVLRCVLSDRLPLPTAHLQKWAMLPSAEFAVGLEHLLKEGDAILLSADLRRVQAAYVVSQTGWTRLLNRLQDLLLSYHRQCPLRPGMPKEECRTQLGQTTDLFGLTIQKAAIDGYVVDLGTAICLAGFAVRFSPRQQQQVDRLLNAHRSSPYAPPTGSESMSAYGLDAELFRALLLRGDLIDVGDDFYFTPQAYEEMVSRILEHLEEYGKITIAQARNLFKSSRRYTLAMLMHLDQKITMRVGDERVLRNPKHRSIDLPRALHGERTD